MVSRHAENFMFEKALLHIHILSNQIEFASELHQKLHLLLTYTNCAK